MRHRHLVAAAACVLAAAFCLPGTAHAADGRFSYTFDSPQGRLTSVLTDPPSGICLTLPEVMGRHRAVPAFAPRNGTASLATVFTDPFCAGDYQPLPPLGGPTPEELKLRSVIFT